MDLDLDRINDNVLYRTLGIRLTRVDAEQAHSTLEPTPQTRWPERDQPHGGILFTQMDTTMATVALGGDPVVTNCATMSLNIQYLAPATGASFSCTARVERRGGRSCFVRGETRDERQALIAVAQGVFRIFR